MKQVLVAGGSVTVRDVPAPQVGINNILVCVAASSVSVGTEMAGVRMSGLPLYRRALKQPEHVKKVLEVMRDQGFKRTYDRVTGKLSAGLPTGYSAAGEVIAVGANVSGFTVGDRVACAGAGIANHAEYIDVPVNLAVRVPEGVEDRYASTVTLGAIALQGVRRSNPTLGETVAVIGLGILGQITAQLLAANGCRVIGTDLDPSRVEIAKENGLQFGTTASGDEFTKYVELLTDGFGADAVIVTAATPSSEVIHVAMQICRKKGRVILVGDVGLDLKRSDMYKKELDFFISCSYGPGRYDPMYEEGGQDYPLPYVRWTENRNMETYLRLIASGKIDLSKLTTAEYSIDRATDAYDALKAEGKKPLIVFLIYPQQFSIQERRVEINPASKKSGKIRVGLIGAGNFATAMHLPNMIKLRSQYEVRAIMSRTGTNAVGVATQFSANYATTDYDQVLNDQDIDLVLISTRHDTHGREVLKGLRAGKDVFVEKPLTISEEELAEIERFYQDSKDPPLLMVGFNRRFSPAVQRILTESKSRATPLVVNYQMNAGFIPNEHWAQGPEGGGRNLGEACHIYDLFAALTGASPTSVQATAITPRGKQWNKTDNFVATIGYSDGSVCTLTYTALGSKQFPKERMTVFVDGKVFSMDDYKSMTVTGAKGAGWSAMSQQKGQLEELEALAKSMLHGAPAPIPLRQIFETTQVAFEVDRQIREQVGSAVSQ